MYGGTDVHRGLSLRLAPPADDSHSLAPPRIRHYRYGENPITHLGMIRNSIGA